MLLAITRKLRLSSQKSYGEEDEEEEEEDEDEEEDEEGALPPRLGPCLQGCILVLPPRAFEYSSSFVFRLMFRSLCSGAYVPALMFRGFRPPRLCSGARTRIIAI